MPISIEVSLRSLSAPSWCQTQILAIGYLYVPLNLTVAHRIAKLANIAFDRQLESHEVSELIGETQGDVTKYLGYARCSKL